MFKRVISSTTLAALATIGTTHVVKEQIKNKGAIPNLMMDPGSYGLFLQLQDQMEENTEVSGSRSPSPRF